MRQDFDFYETPDPLTRWLFDAHDITGDCHEPCVGSGAILRATATDHGFLDREWTTNDLDKRWRADSHFDATSVAAWLGTRPDWTVSNTPFSCWNEIAELALEESRVGVALYLRLSAHEPKKEKFRDWWTSHPPTALYICPRFAHQRSRKSGEWSTDSVTCCWTVWDKRQSSQQIRHAPASVLAELDAYTPMHRARMDALMKDRE